MAAIAITMKNLLASLRGSKTAMSTPVALATVATIDAHRNNTMNVGSARFRLKPFCVGCPFVPAVFFSREATQSASTNVMGIIAKVRVSFTMVA